jgi:hypothetical protein
MVGGCVSLYSQLDAIISRVRLAGQTGGFDLSRKIMVCKRDRDQESFTDDPD